ncbi:MAG: right-handed parallel beta-helix repeat-containing protein [Bacteroidaceae bacterium]|nr:right-handed parallel beta-helix repeat-containing protein [Bacteroidaceae bacterium]
MKGFTHYILLGAMAALLLPTLLCSCNDDEQFTNGAGTKLEFSQDTISFDTVFTGITSKTERIRVYNRNDKGVRIANVKLESGGTSGFMMNVDGQNGVSINDVEVLGDDSVFVFVKVNLPVSSSMESEKITDAIVFTLENGTQQKVLLEASGQNAKVMTGEVLKGDNVFTADELPRVVYDSLVVEKGASLRLLAGTTLYFHNGASLIVHGQLTAEGTQENPVTLRGDRLDKILDYLPYDRLENQWGGVYLAASCQGCTLNHTDIHSGNFGIFCDGIEGNVSITNSVIHNVAGSGLYLKDSKALVANTQISNAKYDCVSIFGGTSEFIHCTIAQFYPWKADHGHALYVSNYIDTEEHLVQAANFYNCFITGYSDDEVYGSPGEQTLNLHFNNCVLLTDVSDGAYFHDCIGESKDSTTYKASNFKILDTHAYIYDFRLDTLSIARGKGSTTYSALYPDDMNGVERGTSPDAGCYQFQ